MAKSSHHFIARSICRLQSHGIQPMYILESDSSFIAFRITYSTYSSIVNAPPSPISIEICPCSFFFTTSSASLISTFRFWLASISGSWMNEYKNWRMLL